MNFIEWMQNHDMEIWLLFPNFLEPEKLDYALEPLGDDIEK